MAHAQKPDSVFQRNGRVHLYRRGCQYSRVLAFLECGSGENDCSNTGWIVPSQTEDCLATHSIRLFPLHFSSRASPCATRFRFHSTFRQAQAVSMCQFVGYHSDIVEFSSRWCDVASLGNRIATFRFTIVVSFSGMEISKKKRKFLPLKFSPLRCLASTLWCDRIYQTNGNNRVQVYCSKTNAKAVSRNDLSHCLVVLMLQYTWQM